ncbi:MAG: hypothetical protein M3R54_02675 [Chloroflexota bacterium]|nr:hypothetical protein [Chloroflexota bacterium]
MSGATRLLYATAALLAVSALVHGAVWLMDGSPWAGPVSWRKPIEFSASFAITLATVGWILTKLVGPAWLRWSIAVTLAIASLAEVALIAMQRWRGVASHFNYASSFDSAVFSAMGVFVGLVALAIVAILVWSLVTTPKLEPDLRVAVRLGLVMLAIAQALGGVLLAQGFAALDQGPVPSPVSSVVVLHGVFLHGVQVLPLAALVLRRLRRPAGYAVR